MNAVKDVFGASHLGVEETRLSDIAYLYQETNDMRFLSIMLCMTGTLVERPFRGLSKGQSYMYFRHTFIGARKAISWTGLPA
jgi:hypothetical protein